MTSLTREDVQHVALLARLRLTEDEIAAITPQLAGILEHITALQEVDVSDVPQTVSILPPISTMRADVAKPSYPPDVLLANTPEREGDFLRVKAVLE